MPDWGWLAVGVGGAVGAAVAVALGLRLFGVSVVGPMFWYEMVKLARRGQQPRLRALLVGLLLVGLFVTYLSEFRGEETAALSGRARLTQERSARFAGRFLIAFLTAQLAAVVLITPAVVGSAISEEKERGTLDFLRSSLLTSREIVVGKLAARLAFVGGVVLAGLPVLALTTLFGGVDVNVLAGGYLVAGVAAVSFGAFSLLSGVHAETLRDVLVRVYGVALGLAVFGSCCGCVPGLAAVSPASTLLYMFVDRPTGKPSDWAFWVNLGVFTGLHLIASIVFVWLAVAGVRSAPPRRRITPPHRRPPSDSDDDAPDEEPIPRAPRARRTFHVPRLGTGDPLLWKERYFAGRLSPAEGGLATGCGYTALTAVLFVLGMVLIVTSASELDRGKWTGAGVTVPLRTFLTGGAVALGLGVGLRAAAAIARERQKQTLDALLTLPVGREELLRAKWLAPLVWVRVWLVVLGCALLAGLATGGEHPLGFVTAAGQVAGFLVFANTLGLWLSVRCRTVARATVYYLLALLALWVGPVVLSPLASVAFEAIGRGDWSDAAAEVVTQLSLPVGVWGSVFGWEEFGQESGRLTRPGGQVVGLVAAVGYAMGAAVLWRDAVRQFRQDGKE